MPFTLGAITTTTFLKLESHKLFNEFVVRATKTVRAGQTVILTGNEEIEAGGTGQTTQQVIGIAMQDGLEGELVTVMMKAYAIIFAQCETAALVAGPVRIGSAAVYNAGDGYVYVDDNAVDHTNQIGWALEGGDADDVIQVALL